MSFEIPAMIGWGGAKLKDLKDAFWSVIDDLANHQGVVNLLRADVASLSTELGKLRADSAVAGVHIHADVDVGKVTTADATNTATAVTLVNDLKAKYTTHIGSTGAHKAADGTNTVSAADATDQGTAETLANEIKADYNAHRSQSGVHYHDDSGNAVSSADASDEGSLVTLVNEIKTDLNAHAALGLSSSSVTPTATADATVGTTKGS
jgi:hypothetical protein